MSEMDKSDAPTLFQVQRPGGLANWKEYCYDLTGTNCNQLTYQRLRPEERRR